MISGWSNEKKWCKESLKGKSPITEYTLHTDGTILYFQCHNSEVETNSWWGENFNYKVVGLKAYQKKKLDRQTEM